MAIEQVYEQFLASKKSADAMLKICTESLTNNLLSDDNRADLYDAYSLQLLHMEGCAGVLKVAFKHIVKQCQGQFDAAVDNATAYRGE